MKQVAFLPLYKVNRPSSRYRVFQFLPALAQEGIDCIVLEAPQLRLKERLLYVPRLLYLVTKTDVLFVQKRMFPGWLLSILTSLKVNIVFDIDDAVYLRPALRKKINRMLRAAKVVVAGNDYLAEYARGYNKNVVVIPTVVDTTLYYPPTEPRHPGDERVIIGWIGSDPNRGDFASMQPVLDWLGKRYGNKIVLRTIGRRPLEMNTKLTIEHVQWTLEGSRQALQQFDIGIMPLDDTEWNQGKCGFKLIQYMAVGAASVASPVGVNQKITQVNQTGFLAENHQAWQTYLARLIDDEDLCQRMGQVAWTRIQQHYSIEAVFPCLLDVLKQAKVAN